MFWRSWAKIHQTKSQIPFPVFTWSKLCFRLSVWHMVVRSCKFRDLWNRRSRWYVYTVRQRYVPASLWYAPFCYPHIFSCFGPVWHKSFTSKIPRMRKLPAYLQGVACVSTIGQLECAHSSLKGGRLVFSATLSYWSVLSGIIQGYWAKHVQKWLMRMRKQFIYTYINWKMP